MSYIHLIKWSVNDQFSSLTARGKKLLWWRTNILLPDVSTGNRLWLGWVSSFSNLWALSRHLTLLISPMLYTMGTSDVLASFITCCIAFISWAVHELCQFAMFLVRMISICNILIENFIYIALFKKTVYKVLWQNTAKGCRIKYISVKLQRTNYINGIYS